MSLVFTLFWKLPISIKHVRFVIYYLLNLRQIEGVIIYRLQP